jgi:hypothetical protein
LANRSRRPLTLFLRPAVARPEAERGNYSAEDEST